MLYLTMAALAGHVRSCAIRNLRKTFGAKKKKKRRERGKRNPARWMGTELWTLISTGGTSKGQSEEHSSFQSLRQILGPAGNIKLDLQMLRISQRSREMEELMEIDAEQMKGGRPIMNWRVPSFCPHTSLPQQGSSSISSQLSHNQVSVLINIWRFSGAQEREHIWRWLSDSY